MKNIHKSNIIIETYKPLNEELVDVDEDVFQDNISVLESSEILYTEDLNDEIGNQIFDSSLRYALESNFTMESEEEFEDLITMAKYSIIEEIFNGSFIEIFAQIIGLDDKEYFGLRKKARFYHCKTRKTSEKAS